MEINPDDTVWFDGVMHTVVMVNPTYAVIELKDRPHVKKQVLVKDLVLYEPNRIS